MAIIWRKIDMAKKCNLIIRQNDELWIYDRWKVEVGEQNIPSIMSSVFELFFCRCVVEIVEIVEFLLLINAYQPTIYALIQKHSVNTIHASYQLRFQNALNDIVGCGFWIDLTCLLQKYWNAVMACSSKSMWAIY